MKNLKPAQGIVIALTLGVLICLGCVADEAVSYIPAEAEYEKGGYEPSVSLVVPGSDKKLIQGAQAILQRIYDGKN